MKYFLRIVLVLFLAAAAVTGVYYYTTGNTPSFLGGNKDLALTTVSKPPVTEKYAALTLLLAQDNYALYKSGDLVVLQVDGKRYEFIGWTDSIDLETPELYQLNLDDDADEELIIRAYAGTDINNEKIYNVYILNKSDDPEIGYDVIILDESIANQLVSRYIYSEIGQLENCKKTVQLAMVPNISGAGIVYDNATGIATNAHTGYFRALQDETGAYLDVAVWNRGTCAYTVNNDGTVHAAMAVLVSYNGSSETQLAGILSMDIEAASNTEIAITDKSIRFTPNSSYAVSTPTLEAVADWKFTENNTATATSKTIAWIKHKPTFSQDTLTQTINGAEELGDMNAVASVTMTSTEVLLKAKDGVTFDKSIANSTQYSVIINRGSETEYDIAYTCSLNEAQTELTITFDRAYAKSEIITVEINYGTK